MKSNTKEIKKAGTYMKNPQNNNYSTVNKQSNKSSYSNQKETVEYQKYKKKRNKRFVIKK